MTNREMAATLFNIATLLREREDNPYRIRAYERGARALMGRRDNVAHRLTTEGETLWRRKWVLGDKMQRKLKELATAGRMEFYDELCETLPPEVAALMQVPGVGPKTARQVSEALGVKSGAEMVAAARDGRLQTVWGFGERRTSQVAQLALFDEAELSASHRHAA